MQLPIWKTHYWFYAATVACGLTLGAQPNAFVSNVAGNNVAVVSTASYNVTANIRTPGAPTGLAVTPDGSTVYVACQGTNVVLALSTATNSVVSNIAVGALPTQLAISPNGSRVYVTDQGSGQVSIIDTSSKSVVATLGVGQFPSGVTFSPDGSRAFVANLLSANVSVINTASNSIMGTFSTLSGPASVAVTPDGQRLYVANQYSGAVTVHDISGNLLATVNGFSSPNSLAMTPNGARVYVVNGNSASVSVIDTASNRVVTKIGVGSLPTSVAITPDGSKALVTNEFDFSLSVIDTGSNTVLNTGFVGIYPVGVATLPPAAQASSAPSCSYSLNSGSASYGSSGGTGYVTVNAPSGCSWSASSNTGWLSILYGSGGSGGGTVAYSAAANQSSSTLSGSLTIAGQTFTVSEAGLQQIAPALVPSSGSNLAQGKPASQSSTAYGPDSVAGAAVDGNTNGSFWSGSVTHTNYESNAWWQVDLGTSATVNSLVIWNRTDCCSSRLTDYWVFVSNTPFNSWDTPANLQYRSGTWNSHQNTAPNPFTTIAAGSAQGRYVRVQLSGADNLSLAEVQVLGTAGSGAGSSLAQGKPASQSSTGYWPNSGAGGGVDGNADGNFWDGSVTHTNYESNAWWQVDLGNSATVNSLVIWNRTDCCTNRLTDYWVFVSNTPFNAWDTPASLQYRAGTWSSHQTSMPSPSTTIAAGGAQGRYVRVQLSGTDFLSLAEVQVFGN
ncbi:MAG: discoidin domain-containing protein [Bryobacteraceae bacterium]